MPKALGGVPFLVVWTAAFTGLRLSELRGLRRGDLRDGKLYVTRAVWRTRVSGTKTVESEAPVLLLPFLQEILINFRSWKTKHVSDDDYIFAGERRGRPLNLHNLANRQIKPAFEKHGIPCRGWHAFRRGLASNLYNLGVHPKVIQSLLRHNDLGTTLAFYVQTPEAESQKALQMLQQVTWDMLKSSS